MGRPITLSATSALVLQFAGTESYPHRLTQRYLASLDLSAGTAMRLALDRVWPHFDEWTKNRKFGIQAFLKKCLRQRPGATQLANLAAGLDPLTLELCARFPNLRAYDVDADAHFMRKKR